MRRLLLGVFVAALLVIATGCGSKPAKLGEPLTVGPLKVTPTSVKDAAPGQGGGAGRVLVALVTLENVSGLTVTEVPTAMVKYTDGTGVDGTMLNGMTDFSIQPGETKQARWAFDVSGTPSQLSIGMTGDKIEFPESGGWSLTQ